jgi:hypothetical protein
MCLLKGTKGLQCLPLNSSVAHPVGFVDVYVLLGRRVDGRHQWASCLDVRQLEILAHSTLVFRNLFFDHFYW